MNMIRHRAGRDQDGAGPFFEDGGIMTHVASHPILLDLSPARIDGRH